MVVIRGLLLLIAVSGLLYFGYLWVGDKEVTPCSPTGFPGRCYHTSQSVCELVWANSEKTCKDWIKKFSFPPGRLTSPIIEKCRIAELDKSLRQSLKSTAECLDMRRELEDWKRQNL